MNFFTDRKKIEQEYIDWIGQHPEIKNSTFTLISFLEMQGYLLDRRAVGVQLSNRQFINGLPNRKLAELLIHTATIPDYDYDYEDNLFECGSIDVYTTSDGTSFYIFEEAVDHETQWLDQPYEGGA